MMYWLAYVAALDTPFNPAVHCTADCAAFSMRMSHREGEIMSVSVEREQSGWAIMRPETPKAVIISKSMTGNPADAVVYARGRIVTMPSDLFGRTQTIDIECSEWDIFQIRDREGREDGRLMRYARADLTDGPATCLIMDDADPDTAETYLQGRSAAWYFDPATFEVSISDLVNGDRIVNLGDSHFHDESPPSATIDEWPTPRVRLNLRAEWTQQTAGFCQIAGRLGGKIQTLSPDFLQAEKKQLPDGLADIHLGTGWTLDGSAVSSKEMVSAPIYDGREGRITYRLQGYVDPIQPTDFTRRHSAHTSFKLWEFDFYHVRMRYEYSQQRIENIELSMEIPMQGVPTVQIEEHLGELGTVDLTVEANNGTLRPTEPWEVRFYAQGTRIVYFNSVYECTADHNAVGFYQKPPNWSFVPWEQQPPDFSWHPYWKRVESLAPLRFYDTEFAGHRTGQDTIAHCMLRLRKRAIERLRCLNVVTTYVLDESNHDVTLRDSIRLEVPIDGVGRPMVGKVTGLEIEWDAESGGRITITSGVCVGTGGDAVTPDSFRTPYGATPNYMWDYVGAVETDEPVFSVGGDVEYVVDADPVRRPIDAPPAERLELFRPERPPFEPGAHSAQQGRVCCRQRTKSFDGDPEEPDEHPSADARPGQRRAVRALRVRRRRDDAHAPGHRPERRRRAMSEPRITRLIRMTARAEDLRRRRYLTKPPRLYPNQGVGVIIDDRGLQPGSEPVVVRTTLSPPLYTKVGNTATFAINAEQTRFWIDVPREQLAEIGGTAPTNSADYDLASFVQNSSQFVQGL